MGLFNGESVILKAAAEVEHVRREFFERELWRRQNTSKADAPQAEPSEVAEKEPTPNKEPAAAVTSEGGAAPESTTTLSSSPPPAIATSVKETSPIESATPAKSAESTITQVPTSATPPSASSPTKSLPDAKPKVSLDSPLPATTPDILPAATPTKAEPADSKKTDDPKTQAGPQEPDNSKKPDANAGSTPSVPSGTSLQEESSRTPVPKPDGTNPNATQASQSAPAVPAATESGAQSTLVKSPSTLITSVSGNPKSISPSTLVSQASSVPTSVEALSAVGNTFPAAEAAELGPTSTTTGVSRSGSLLDPTAVTTDAAGLDVTRVNRPGSLSHNSMIIVIVVSSIVGFLVLGTAFALIMRRCFRKRRVGRAESPPASPLLDQPSIYVQESIPWRSSTKSSSGKAVEDEKPYNYSAGPVSPLPPLPGANRKQDKDERFAFGFNDKS
ncbi:hypothetical protein PVAG01_08490 [Phlyctema vagabunda]|uniref:Uncharacterized protein n=1 Tax=Phlyctema vagabunda TaxID=108571 RepID=A0ABR4PA78_9HELO